MRAADNLLEMSRNKWYNTPINPNVIETKTLTNINISQCVNKINKDPAVLEKKSLEIIWNT